MTRRTSGDKGGRQSLGCCRGGRLILNQCRQSGGHNLLWMGVKPLRGTFDEALRSLIAEPVVDLGEGLFWLCRLPPGDYALEERAGGGQRLFRLEYQLKPAPRWRIVATRNGR